MTQRGAGARPVGLPVALLALLALNSVLSMAGALWLTPDWGSDLRAFLESGIRWSQGGLPYAASPGDIPNLTPPFLLPVFSLYAQLGFVAAPLAFVVTSLACVMLAARVISRRVMLPVWQVVVALLGTAPAAIALGLGQLGFVMLLAFTLAWDSAHRRAWARSGAWMGVLCALKPYFGLVALWFAWRRHWSALGALMAALAVCGGLSVAVAGTESLRQWIDALAVIDWQAHIYNASATGVGARLFGTTVGLRATAWTPLAVSAPLEYGANILLIGCLLIAAVRALRHDGDNVDRVFAVTGAAAVLLAPLAWVHYLPLLAGPVLGSFRRARWAILALVLALVPYQVLLNRRYDRLGTLIVGQWAFAMALLLFAAAVTGTRVRANWARRSGLREAGVTGQGAAVHG